MLIQTTTFPYASALVAELVTVLAAHQELRCRPEVHDDEKQIAITLTFLPTSNDEGLEILSLADEARAVRDLAQMRGFADRYGIPPDQLRRFLSSATSPLPVPDTPQRLSVHELGAVISTVEAYVPSIEEVPDLASALTKLHTMLNGEIF